jgi:hypothetical protein
MPPRKDEGGPQPSPAGSRPAQTSATATATAARATSTPASIRGGSRTKLSVPVAAASVFGPVGRRKSWWYTYRCAACGAYLFGRARSLDDVPGERRAGCGHRVRVMAARIYTQPPEALT